MTIVVTGARGWIGAQLCRALEAHRQPFRAMTRNATSGTALPMPALGGAADWRPALENASAVVHLAARVHQFHDSGQDALAAYRATNTAGTLRLAEQAAAAGVHRFVFVSTVKVNGESTLPGQAFTESQAPAPRGPYAISKHEAELGLAAISARTGMEVVIVRPPLVYGAGVKANFAALVRAVARGLPLPLGAVDNRRSLVGIDNLVDLLLLCLEHPAAANQTFLVSDGEDLSTPDLLRRMGQAMGRPARLLPVPPLLLKAGATLLGRRDAIDRLCGNLQVDITKARTLLGWKPPVSVDEALRRAAQGMER